MNERCSLAFKENTLEPGVIGKCAAFAAREHGDARRALDLLRIAGELTERDGKSKLGLEYIDKANQKMEKDKILDIIESEPAQFQIVLRAIMELTKDRKNGKELGSFFTGDVYNKYQEICASAKFEILTQRRVSDIIAEIDMLGLINARVISKGRHGRTREIKSLIPSNLVEKADGILFEALNL